MSKKNPLIPAGIDPATFRFVAQQLNHCATAVPYLICVTHQIITGHCFHTILKRFRITDSVSPSPWDTTLKTVRFIRNDSSLSLSRAFKVSRNVQHFIIRTCLRNTLYTTQEEKFPHISTERKYDPFSCHTQLFTKLQFFFTLYFDYRRLLCVYVFIFCLFEGNKVKQGKLKDIKLIVL